MRSVLGVAAVLAVIGVAGLAHAQEGWGTPPDPEPGAQPGWGTPAPTPTPTPAPAPQPEAGWGTPAPQPQPAQARDIEAGEGTGTWGRPATTPPPTPTPVPDEPAVLTGNEFRLAHRVALGGHNHMSGAFIAAGDALTGGVDFDFTTPWLNLSFMYTVSALFSIDVFAGFSVRNLANDGVGATNFEMAFGPRALFTLATFDRTRLYTGIAVAMLIGYADEYNNEARSDGGCGGSCGGADMYGVALAAPLGIEYRFRSAPHVALSVELSFHLVYESFGTRRLDSDGRIEASDLVGQFLMGMGNPRVTEGTANVLDYLNFLTIGLHYML